MASKVRASAAAVAATGLVLLAAACGGSPVSASGGRSLPDPGASADSSSPVAYSHCMRSHGVPKYPDPSSGGVVPKGGAQQFGVSSSVFSTAQQACQHLLRAGSFRQQARECLNAGDCSPAMVQQMLTSDRAFAHCMRSHGISYWPDPVVDSQGRPVFNLVPVNISDRLPSVSAGIAECQRLDPAVFGLEEN